MTPATRANLLTVGMFIVFWLGVSVMCNLSSLLLGLQHPSLPAWWLQLVSWGITGTALVVAVVATWLIRRAQRQAAPPPPPPATVPPRDVV